MLVKLPIVESTLRNWSGRSQATVKAQIPPELEPQVARRSGSAVMASEYLFVTKGMASFSKNLAYASPNESYSKPRLLTSARVPGFKKMATVTGISRQAIRLSNTTGTRQLPFVLI